MSTTASFVLTKPKKPHRAADHNREANLIPLAGMDYPQVDQEQPPKAGSICPRCGNARLDYDGLLSLACPACGFALAGCFT